MKSNNNIPTMAAGIALTMAAAGGVAYMMNAKGMKRQRKQLKRQASKAIDNISHWADTINGMMG